MKVFEFVAFTLPGRVVLYFVCIAALWAAKLLGVA